MSADKATPYKPIPYAEFAVQSNFSFLRGASKPEELVVAASLSGHSALGLADRNTVAGVVRAWQQAKVEGLAYHPGARLVFSDGTPDVLAYPRDRAGWGHLCRMLTVANARGEKGAPDLRLEDFLEWGGSMSLAVMPGLEKPAEDALSLLRLLKDRFGDALRIAAAPSYGGNDRFRLAQAAGLAERLGLPLMAVNDVRYHAAERRPLQDVLTAIRLNIPVAEAGFELAANAERHLKPPSEMARLFRDHQQALAETIRFEESLTFSLKELQHNYPDEPTRDGATPQQELERLAWEGAARRFPGGVSADTAKRIREELALIDRLQYSRYFLTVHDIVQYARTEGILCQGRGSAANSVVCYCIGITEVGPDKISSLFERFISEERNEPPDIDVDFEHEKREIVMQYVYEKYSNKHTALAASVVTYRGRSSLREVAKAMGLSEDVMSALSGSIWGWSSAELGETEARAGGLDLTDVRSRHVIDRANDILEFPRHLSQHVGGFVITKDRLDEIVPIVKTAMDDRKMVEWDKDDLDSVGLLKVDILALGMLTCLQRCFGLMKAHYGLDLTLSAISDRTEEEGPVYAMISRADTIGVFQVESRAQMSMLPRLRPKCFYDLVIEVAIVRPGPIQGDMVHPYLRRREGREDPEYPKPELKEILSKTLGVPLFQEQAMQIAIVAGGFSPAKADKLRRAMATFRRTGTIGTLKKEMIEGMVSRGYERDFAERCFKQIEGFGEYGFPESHAASFALLVYASSWFKAYYPDVFCAAILNSQPMGFYRPAQLVRDAREHGVEIREVDVNLSHWDCTLEEAPLDPARIAPRHAGMRGTIRTCHAVRLGFRQVKGLSEEDMKLLVLHRGAGYDSVRDLWLRSGLTRSVIERLAEADAFRSLGLDRREALWAVRALDEKGAAERLPLFERPELRLRDFEEEMQLPSMPLGEHVFHDYRTVSMSLKAHPVSFLRQRFDEEGALQNFRLDKLANGTRVSVAGLVLIRQRPGSAKGVIFMTLEDETGIANAIVWKKVFERHRPIVLGARLVRVIGRLQSASGVIHIVAERIEDLSPRLGELFADTPRVYFRSDEAGKTSADSRADKNRNEAADLLSPGGRLLSAEAARVMPKGRNFH
ncbi:error-prone DNA polymerase [Aquamicrobium sp. LC103]|uniref:error-prone DNA polymerase n=1 Tax=Aquamicrobium sp. LC103 TaxID=1120658 RepID=UPI00063EBDD0|nr:error-prone DNA polymerase [Aquamicrobium sp. LC103]TKT82909.1 DNA polymerase III subunit alpha [Aquamicrobium sp. LC103]